MLQSISTGSHLCRSGRMVPFKHGLLVKSPSFKKTMRREANDSTLNLFDLEIDECQARGLVHVLKSARRRCYWVPYARYGLKTGPVGYPMAAQPFSRGITLMLTHTQAPAEHTPCHALQHATLSVASLARTSGRHKRVCLVIARDRGCA